MQLGIECLEKAYKEIGKPNSVTYRSADGLRQFRIDKNSLLGGHNPWKPHVHVEIYAPNGELISSNHVIFGE